MGTPDGLYAAGAFGERAGLLLWKRNYCAVRLCRGADRKNARGVSDAIADLGEGAEDDGTRGGELIQMVHDLDLVTVDREDVLLAGIGADILACGHGCGVGVCRFVADGADVALFYTPFDGVEVPAGVVGLAVLVLVFEVGQLGPVGAEGDECVLGNAAVLVLSSFEIINGQDKVGVCGALLVLVDYTERMH